MKLQWDGWQICQLMEAAKRESAFLPVKQNELKLCCKMEIPAE